MRGERGFCDLFVNKALCCLQLQMLTCAGSVLLKPTFLGGALSPACPPLTWERYF